MFEFLLLQLFALRSVTVAVGIATNLLSAGMYTTTTIPWVLFEIELKAFS